MSVRRLLAAAAVPVVAAALALTTATPAQAAGIPPTEQCIEMDEQPVLCVTFGAEFNLVPSEPGTVAGALTVTLGCRIRFAECVIDPVVVPVGKTGVVRNPGPLPTVGVRLLTTFRVPMVCFDEICTDGFDVPVYAPYVAGTVGTAYVAGYAVPLRAPYPLGA